jgi:hypothetical protein
MYRIKNLNVFLNIFNIICYIIIGIVETNRDWVYDPIGLYFLKRFGAQPPTISYKPDGTVICSNATDSIGHSLVFSCHEYPFEALIS